LHTSLRENRKTRAKAIATENAVGNATGNACSAPGRRRETEYTLFKVTGTTRSPLAWKRKIQTCQHLPTLNSLKISDLDCAENF
jgi:hypothetical protein